MKDVERTRIALDPERLTQYVGLYKDEGLVLSLSPGDDVLVGTFPAPNSRFVPCGKAEFFLEDDPEYVLRLRDLTSGVFGRAVLETPTHEIEFLRS